MDVKQCEIGSLPDTSTHGQRLESNPRPSDVESNTLSTGPHAPTSSRSLFHEELSDAFCIIITIFCRVVQSQDNFINLEQK